MKRALILLLMGAVHFAVAQAPQAFNYQAVARDAAGNSITNQSIGVQISILVGSATGTVVYAETHQPTTDAYGSFTLEIGRGTATTGAFSTIDWPTGSYFLDVSIDVTGGTNYVQISTTELLSVPYALYADESAPQNLSISGDTLSIAGGNEVVLPPSYPVSVNGIPQMTQSQINTVLPSPGYVVYNTTTNTLNVYNGLEWLEMTGVAIGNNITNGGVPCPGTPTVSYGGQTYNTVQIGNQCWLKENLNIGTMLAAGDTATNNGSFEKHCYDDLAANCDTFGGMYSFNELMDWNTTPGSQGICPAGWHIPTELEYTILVDNTGGPNVAGTALRLNGGSGMDLVLGGSAKYVSSAPMDYRRKNVETYVYSSTVDPDDDHHWLYAKGGRQFAGISANSGIIFASSVRCIKD